jgi:hypothetical protein
VTFGDYLSPAWTQVVARAFAARRKGRSGKFAPGGRCSRLVGAAAARLGDRSALGVRRPCPAVAGSDSLQVAQSAGVLGGGHYNKNPV